MEVLIIICIFIVAFLYSSVGHGGASGYLALMAIFAIAPAYMKSTAFLLNIFVSAVAFFIFFRAGFFRWKILLPFVITSIPMTFIGAMLQINPTIYKIILGIFLIIASLRLLYKPTNPEKIVKSNFLVSLLIGSVLGLLSGMIGIGGGIILSPLLLLFKWTNIKETAAVSAIFILLNSIAGIAGVYVSGIKLPPEIIYWLLAGVGGGFLGAYVASKKFSLKIMKYSLAFVLFIAALKLFLV